MDTVTQEPGEIITRKHTITPARRRVDITDLPYYFLYIILWWGWAGLCFMVVVLSVGHIIPAVIVAFALGSFLAGISVFVLLWSIARYANRPHEEILETVKQQIAPLPSRTIPTNRGTHVQTWPKLTYGRQSFQFERKHITAMRTLAEKQLHVTRDGGAFHGGNWSTVQAIMQGLKLWDGGNVWTDKGRDWLVNPVSLQE